MPFVLTFSMTVPNGLAERIKDSCQAEITHQGWGPTHQQPDTPDRAEKSGCRWLCLKGVSRTQEQSRIPEGCSLDNCRAGDRGFCWN